MYTKIQGVSFEVAKQHGVMLYHCYSLYSHAGIHSAIITSRKYWRELNLVVEPKIAIARILADLNLVVRYRIAIRIYASRKFWRILIWRL